MKKFSDVITFIKMIAKYGAYIIVIVDCLNTMAEKFEAIENPNKND